MTSKKEKVSSMVSKNKQVGVFEIERKENKIIIDDVEYDIENYKMKKCKYTVFFDLESTGLDTSKDRIIQIAMTKIDNSTLKTVKQFECKIRPSNGEKSSPGAFKKHGISDSDLVDCPEFGDVAPYIKNFLKDSDIGGHNVYNFDIPLLLAEFKRYDENVRLNLYKKRLIDTYLMDKKINHRILSKIYKEYTDIVGYNTGEIDEELKYNEKLVNAAHNALADVIMCIDIYKCMLIVNKLDDLIVDILNNNNGRRVDFGGFFYRKDGNNYENYYIKDGTKYPNEQAINIKDPEYYCWMYNEGNFSYDTKYIVAKLYEEITGYPIPIGGNYKNQNTMILSKSKNKEHQKLRYVSNYIKYGTLRN